jgi:hypothetical protein
MEEFHRQIGRGQITRASLQLFLRNAHYKVDSNVDPSISSEVFEVAHHNKIGVIKWNPTKVKLLCLPEQKNPPLGGLNGEEMFQKFFFADEKKERHLNANFLDFLLDHQQLIPSAWRKQNLYPCFWGTVIKNRKTGELAVLEMYFNGDRFDKAAHYFSHGFNAHRPAVILTN